MAFVYAILVDGVIRYIGKGNASRPIAHVHEVRRIIRRRSMGQKINTTLFYNKLAKACLAGSMISHFMIFEAATDLEAFDLEIGVINAAPDGQLWNLHPGGRGMTSKFQKAYFAEHPEYKREKIKQLLLVSPSSEERSRQASKSWADKDHREKQSKSRKAAWEKPERRIKQTAALKGKPKPNGFGAKITAANNKRWSDPNEHARLSEIKIAQWKDPKFRTKMLKANSTRRSPNKIEAGILKP